jgi:hypothetical protein
MIPRVLRQEFPHRARVRASTPYGQAAPIGTVFLFARRKGEDSGPAFACQVCVKKFCGHPLPAPTTPYTGSPFPIEVLAAESAATRIFQFTEAEVELLPAGAEDEVVAA